MMRSVIEAITPVVVIVLLTLGVLLLWLASTARQWRRPQEDRFMLPLMIFGTASLVTGMAIAIGSLLLAVIVPISVPVIVSWLLAFGWNARGNRHMLLWTIAHAAQTGIPIPEALRALEGERRDRIGRRAGLVAARIERGESLSNAISSEVGFPSLEARLAIGMGESLGLLGPALNPVSQPADIEDLRLKLAEGVLYLLGLMLLGAGVVSFMAFKIIPVVLDMLEEFELKPAAMSELFIVTLPYLAQIALPTLLLLAILFFVVLLRHLNWIPSDIPLMSWLGKPLDRARILNTLALSVDHSRSIQKVMGLLTTQYPKAFWRRRLGRALDAIERGEPWIAALARVGIIRPTGQAVLASAERAGNLPWAMREIAHIDRRQYIATAQMYHRLVGTAVILLLGVLFLFISSVVFLPLVQLINGLAQ